MEKDYNIVRTLSRLSTYPAEYAIVALPRCNRTGRCAGIRAQSRTAGDGAIKPGPALRQYFVFELRANLPFVLVPERS